MPTSRLSLIATALVTASVSVLHGAEWITNGSADWDNNANWDNPATFPNAAGAAADFSTINITGNRVVDLNVPITIGSLLLGDTDDNRRYDFDIGTAGTLTFDNGGSSSLTKTSGATDYFRVPFVLNDNLVYTNSTALSPNFLNVISGVGGITVDQGFLQLRSTSSVTYSGPTIVNNGAEVMFTNGDLTPNPNTNVQLNDGVLSRYNSSTISRTLGTGAGGLQVLGGESGFSGTKTLTVALDGGAEVVWGGSGEGLATGYFNPNSLVLAAPSANVWGRTNFTNPLDLNGAMRTIAINKVSATIDSAAAAGGKLFGRLQGSE